MIQPRKDLPQMDPDRLAVYLRSLEPDDDPFLKDVELRARQLNIPILRRETVSLLITLVAALKPEYILEVGTATGYSALFMASVGGDALKIDTIERNETNAAMAEENFRLAKEHGFTSEIRLLRGDAADILPGLGGPYDLIFMDAAKGQYPAFLPEVLRLLRPGGMLFTDNVLQDGTLLESRFAVTRRDRTIHARMRDYLYELKHNDSLMTSVIPLGDGVAVSYKKED